MQTIWNRCHLLKIAMCLRIIFQSQSHSSRSESETNKTSEFFVLANYNISWQVSMWLVETVALVLNRKLQDSKRLCLDNWNSLYADFILKLFLICWNNVLNFVITLINLHSWQMTNINYCWQLHNKKCEHQSVFDLSVFSGHVFSENDTQTCFSLKI